MGGSPSIVKRLFRKSWEREASTGNCVDIPLSRFLSAQYSHFRMREKAGFKSHLRWVAFGSESRLQAVWARFRFKAGLLTGVLKQARIRRDALVGFLLLLTAGHFLSAADYPAPEPGDYTIRDFHFQSGETLPELRIHYRTLGSARRDGQGMVTNAVLILHGTTGNGSNFLRREF